MNLHDLDDLHPALAELIKRLDDVHPSELPPSIRELRASWSTPGSPIWPEDSAVVLRPDLGVSQAVGGDREARRLRAILQALEEHDGANVLRWSCKIDEFDGITIIATSPNPENEIAAVSALAHLSIMASQFVAMAFVQIIEREHPRIFRKRWDEAVIAADRAIDAQRKIYDKMKADEALAREAAR